MVHNLKTPSQSKLIHAARLVNDYKPNWIIDRVKSRVVDFLSESQNKKISDVKVSCFVLRLNPILMTLRVPLNTKELALRNLESYWSLAEYIGASCNNGSWSPKKTL